MGRISGRNQATAGKTSEDCSGFDSRCANTQAANGRYGKETPTRTC